MIDIVQSPGVVFGGFASFPFVVASSPLVIAGSPLGTASEAKQSIVNRKIPYNPPSPGGRELKGGGISPSRPLPNKGG